MNKQLGWSLVKYSGPFLELTREERQPNGPENKKTNNDT